MIPSEGGDWEFRARTGSQFSQPGWSSSITPPLTASPSVARNCCRRIEDFGSSPINSSESKKSVGAFRSCSRRLKSATAAEYSAELGTNLSGMEDVAELEHYLVKRFREITFPITSGFRASAVIARPERPFHF